MALDISSWYASVVFLASHILTILQRIANVSKLNQKDHQSVGFTMYESNM